MHWLYTPWVGPGPWPCWWNLFPRYQRSLFVCTLWIFSCVSARTHTLDLGEGVFHVLIFANLCLHIVAVWWLQVWRNKLMFWLKISIGHNCWHFCLPGSWRHDRSSWWRTMNAYAQLQHPRSKDSQCMKTMYRFWKKLTAINCCSRAI